MNETLNVYWGRQLAGRLRQDDKDGFEYQLKSMPRQGGSGLEYS